MLVVDSLGRLTRQTRNADNGGGVVRENEADEPVVAASFHLRDFDRRASTYSDAEVVYFMPKGREGFVGVAVGGAAFSGR